LLAPAPALGQEASSLPNGASSLQETYGDWVVSCAATEAGTRCALSQQQSQQGGQRVLAIELAVADTAVSGSLVLPFGLALGAGAALQVDDQAARLMLPFSTCLPVGCLVRLNFDADQVAAMRSGSQLKVGVTVEDTGEPATLNISLSGFSAALDRTAALSD
jgi:invasion protein IalB